MSLVNPFINRWCLIAVKLSVFSTSIYLLGHKYINQTAIPRSNLIPPRNFCRRKVELLKIWWMVVVIKRLCTLWRKGNWWLRRWGRFWFWFCLLLYLFILWFLHATSKCTGEIETNRSALDAESPANELAGTPNGSSLTVQADSTQWFSADIFGPTK